MGFYAKYLKNSPGEREGLGCFSPFAPTLYAFSPNFSLYLTWTGKDWGGGVYPRCPLPIISVNRSQEDSGLKEENSKIWTVTVNVYNPRRS